MRRLFLWTDGAFHSGLAGEGEREYNELVMQYDISSLRRQERAMSEPQAKHLLEEGIVAVLAMQQLGGGAYAVPMNYVWDGEAALYLHCAPEGHKLRCLSACPHVSLVITEAVKVLPAMFSTAYRSLVVQGVAHVVTAGSEKLRALALMLQKYAPDNLSAGQVYMERAVAQTTILRVDISTWCGKEHRHAEH